MKKKFCFAISVLALCTLGSSLAYAAPNSESATINKSENIKIESLNGTADINNYVAAKLEDVEGKSVSTTITSTKVIEAEAEPGSKLNLGDKKEIEYSDIDAPVISTVTIDVDVPIIYGSEEDIDINISKERDIKYEDVKAGYVYDKDENYVKHVNITHKI